VYYSHTHGRIRPDVQSCSVLSCVFEFYVVHYKNRIFKVADDTYLIAPAVNSESSVAELAHIKDWDKNSSLCKKNKKSYFEQNVNNIHACEGIMRVLS